MSVLVNETRSVQWPVSATDKVRLEPTVATLLDTARPAGQTKSDQLRLGALKMVLIADIVDEQFARVHGRLGVLLSHAAPAGKGLPAREIECPGCGLHFVMTRDRH